MLLRYPPIIIIYLIPAFLIAITIHELSHAYFSYKLGDPTAKNMGRLTFNPLKHLDVLGTIMILVSGFGWAKPVPTNPMYYRDRRKGTMVVGFAGPLSNILMALVFSIPMAIIGIKYGASIESVFDVEKFYFSGAFDLESIVFNLTRFLFIINVNLAVFNILPVPPLDGSKILAGILPPRQYYKMVQYENYIAIVFLLLVFILPGILYSIMSPFIWVVETAIRSIVVPIINALA
ncbi:site-2 protease family protein [Candidatus Parcubacteria bacterium]|nr:MAG: site-2 protease family protein [Candidatus Parcubacteria bacterium]